MAIDPLESFETDGAIEDTSAVFGSFPAPDEPLFFSALPLFTPPTFDGGIDLSNDFFPPTPLSFVQPGSEAQIQNAETKTKPLPQARESRIKEFTMQPTEQLSQPSSSPEATGNNKRKRKKSMTDGDDGSSSPDSMSDTVKRSGRKNAHNMIEKRYRTNLNQKIAALRDAVPSLRATNKNSKDEDLPQENLQGLAPAHKLNKATILMKATEYIRHLEQRNKVLTQENAALRSRIDAFEIMVLARQGQNAKQAAPLKLRQTRMW